MTDPAKGYDAATYDNNAGRRCYRCEQFAGCMDCSDGGCPLLPYTTSSTRPNCWADSSGSTIAVDQDVATESDSVVALECYPYVFHLNPVTNDGTGMYRPRACPAPDFVNEIPTILFPARRRKMSQTTIAPPDFYSTHKHTQSSVKYAGSSMFSDAAYSVWSTSKATKLPTKLPTKLAAAKPALLTPGSSLTFGFAGSRHTDLASMQLATVPLAQPLFSETVDRLAKTVLTNAKYYTAAPVKTSIPSINATNLILTSVTDCNTVCVVDDGLSDAAYYNGLGCWGVRVFFERVNDGDFC